MSTQVIEATLEAYKEDLMQYIADEPLDILDEFTEEEIADFVISIAKKLMYKDTSVGHLVKFNGNRLNKDYVYKVNNLHKGFVSISDECSTGVSRTEYYPFYHDEEDGYYTGLCCLAQMINEAWYHCIND